MIQEFKSEAGEKGTICLFGFVGGFNICFGRHDRRRQDHSDKGKSYEQIMHFFILRGPFSTRPTPIMIVKTSADLNNTKNLFGRKLVLDEHYPNGAEKP
jgi:hypothetical protein